MSDKKYTAAELWDALGDGEDFFASTDTRTIQQKRDAVAVILRLHSGFSDRMISKLCGVTDQMVAKIRKHRDSLMMPSLQGWSYFNCESGCENAILQDSQGFLFSFCQGCEECGTPGSSWKSADESFDRAVEALMLGAS